MTPIPGSEVRIGKTFTIFSACIRTTMVLLCQIPNSGWNLLCLEWEAHLASMTGRIPKDKYCYRGQGKSSQGRERVFSFLSINYKLGSCHETQFQIKALPENTIKELFPPNQANDKILPCETVKFSCLQETFLSCYPQQPHCNWNFSLLITVDSNYTRCLIPPHSN